MAKVAKTAIKNSAKKDENAKNFTKVIKAIRNPKSGSYSYKEGMVHKDKVKDFIAEK